MTTLANNSDYAVALLLIGLGITGITFLLALFAYFVLLCCGRKIESKFPLKCTNHFRSKVLIGLLVVMLIFLMLVWAVLAGFSQIHVALAAVLSFIHGTFMILLINLLHLRSITEHNYRYTNADPPMEACGAPPGFKSLDYDDDYTASDRRGGAASTRSLAEMYAMDAPLKDGSGGSNSNNNNRGSPNYGHQAANPTTCAEKFKLFASDMFVACVRHQERRLGLGISFAVYLMATAFALVALHGVCWCTNPRIITTWLTRRADTPFCHEDQFCHLYPLLGVNSSRMRLIGHVVTSGGKTPKSTYANICQVTVPPSGGSACVGPEWRVEGTVIDHAHISEDYRFVSHITLTTLDPRTYYRAEVTFVLASGASTSRAITFRSISAPDDMNSTVRFVSGGDFFSGQSGKDSMREALQLESDPDFIYIGGDISYSNNMRYCYYRVDYALDIFASLRNVHGVQIPFVFIIGNHESGGYLSDGFDNLFFQQQYFANFDSDIDPPNLAEAHHMHILSGTAGIVMLDSDLMEAIPSQNDYLRESLEKVYDGWKPDPNNVNDKPPASARVAMVSYHNPAYPSLRSFDNTQSARVRQYWCPIIDQYKVPLVLEFHDHAYKRTHPIRGQTIQPDGKGTVYIGDGGLGLDRDVSSDKSDGQYHKVKELEHNIQLVTITPDKRINVRTYGDMYAPLDDVTLKPLD